MPPVPDGTKAYLEYLDREMTIMGILSSFCIAVVALVLKSVAGADSTSGWLFHDLSNHRMVEVSLGCAFLVLAAFCFYLQRSKLALTYGAICMAYAHHDPEHWEGDRWLIEADSWDLWLRYRTGFMLLSMSAIVFSLAVCRSEGFDPGWLRPLETASLILIMAGTGIHHLILTTYRYDDHPILKNFPFRNLLHHWRLRKETPKERKQRTAETGSM
jgi:hypothetical protein